jgi:hypothetical protein
VEPCSASTLGSSERDIVILFITGFNRSGTTVLVDAVAAATAGAPLTAGDLARHGAPGLAARLRRIFDSADPIDRGVDGRLVTESMPEEYGWFLYHLGTGRRRSLRFRSAATADLRRVADALSARSGVAVLKNPSDTGHEDELLAAFPDAQIIISRRRVAGITASSYRAMDRYITTSAYGEALRGDDFWVRFLARALRTRTLARLVRFGTRWGLRVRLMGYLRTFSRLPADRVAFLSYDELVEDPDRGARWAAHLLDAGRLSKEFRAALSADTGARPPESSWIDRELDRRWARVWKVKRGEQLRLGVLSHPAGDRRAGSASVP